MSDLFSQYTQKVTQCMLKYQYIELALKLCLIRFHATSMYRLAGYLHHEIPMDAIENAAMGQLIKWFKSFSQNHVLLVGLNKIRAERDFIAHQGFVFTLEEHTDDSVVLAKLGELEEPYQRASSCLAELFSEIEVAEKIVKRAYEELRARSQAEGKSISEALRLPSLNSPP